MFELLLAIAIPVCIAFASRAALRRYNDRYCDTTEDESLYKRYGRSLVEKIEELGLTTEKDVSKRISDGIIFFRKCSSLSIEHSLKSASLQGLVDDFNREYQTFLEHNPLTTSLEDRVEVVTNVSDLFEKKGPKSPFEGLEISNCYDGFCQKSFVTLLQSSELASVFTYLKNNLHMVEISRCALVTIPLDFLSLFPNLTNLNLSFNEIETIQDDFYLFASQSCSLKILNLSSNKLSKIPNFFIDLFTKHHLHTLNIQENDIDLNTGIPKELKYISGKDKSAAAASIQDFTSPIVMKTRKNSPRVRLSFSNVTTRKSSHSHSVIRLICHMQRVPQQVMDRIYLGPVAAATNVEVLRKLGIDSVLCINTITPFPDEKERKNIFKNYKIISETDEEKTNLIAHFEECFEYIDTCLKDPESKVLVHCSAGMSRSATIMIAYVMKKLDMNAEDAFQYVHERRCCIAPNGGFLMQLELYERIGRTFCGPEFEKYIYNNLLMEKEHPSLVTLNYLKLDQFPPKFLFDDISIRNELEKRLSKVIIMELQWNCIQNLDYFTTNMCLKDLVELDLSHNLLESIPVEIFTHFTELRILNISYNKIHTLPTITEESIPRDYQSKIVDLRLGHNTIEKIDDQLYKYVLKNVELLDLSHNLLSSLPPLDTFKSNMQSLRVLSLFNNKFNLTDYSNTINTLKDMGKIIYLQEGTSNNN